MSYWFLMNMVTLFNQRHKMLQIKFAGLTSSLDDLEWVNYEIDQLLDDDVYFDISELTDHLESLNRSENKK